MDFFTILSAILQEFSVISLAVQGSGLDSVSLSVQTDVSFTFHCLWRNTEKLTNRLECTHGAKLKVFPPVRTDNDGDLTAQKVKKYSDTSGTKCRER